MPQYAPIVLADAATTPVNHTFEISTLSGGKLKAVNRAAPTIETQEILAIEVKPAPASNGVSTVRISLGMPDPVTDSTTGKVSVGEINSFVATFNLAGTSTLARRKNLEKMVANLFDNPLVIEAITEPEPFYG